MSPNDLELFMWHVWSAAPNPRASNQMNAERLDKFVADGLLVPKHTGSGYSLTLRGEAWKDMILSTPYPEMRWVDPRNEVGQ